DLALELDALEIRQLDLRQYLERERIGEVGLSADDLFDRGRFVRNRDLRFHGKLETAVADDLGVELADYRLDGLGHHRLAVDLSQVRDRHLAGSEAAQLDAILEFAEPLGHPRLEVGCRYLDLEFALEAVGKSLGDFHGDNLRRSLRSVDWAVTRRGACVAAWWGRRDLNPHDFRHGNLNPARLPVPPRPRRRQPTCAAAGRRGLYHGQSRRRTPKIGAGASLLNCGFSMSRGFGGERAKATDHTSPTFVVTARRRADRTVAGKSSASPGAGPRRPPPGPAPSPASPGSQPAAPAASNPGMPWARQPAAMPASTSPEPAVASQGGALSAIAARPSGAATT